MYASSWLLSTRMDRFTVNLPFAIVELSSIDARNDEIRVHPILLASRNVGQLRSPAGARSAGADGKDPKPPIEKSRPVSRLGTTDPVTGQ